MWSWNLKITCGGFCFLILFGGYLSAQPLQPSFQHLTSSEGLSDYTIYTMEQDASGFIWIATRNGLDRYDGYEVKTYYNEPGNASSLLSNVVFELYSDRSGRLWAGNDLGVCLYNRKNDNFTRIESDETDVAKKSVHVICEDVNGTIWVGTSGGLLKINTDTKKMMPVFFLQDSTGKQLYPNIEDLIADEKGNLWIAGYFGIAKYNIAGGTTTILKSDDFPANQLRRLTQNDQHEIWAASVRGKLVRLDENGISASHYDLADYYKKGFDIRAMVFDHAGRLWMADPENGLIAFDPAEKQFQLFKYDPAKTDKYY